MAKQWQNLREMLSCMGLGQWIDTSQTCSGELATAIDELARFYVYLDRTDHLTDSELLAELRRLAVIPMSALGLIFEEGKTQSLAVLDMSNLAGENEPTTLQLEFYCNTIERKVCKAKNPAGELPPMRRHKADRDKTLPLHPDLESYYRNRLNPKHPSHCCD